MFKLLPTPVLRGVATQTTKLLRHFSLRHNLMQEVGAQQPPPPPAEEEKLLISDVNGVKRVVLNDLKKRNALSLALLNNLHSVFTSLKDNGDNTQVVILAHNGPVFSAGHDLKELREQHGSDYHSEIFSRCSEVMKLVQDVRVPVIAEVNGVATAAGCQLVATCDLAVASDTSVFATPGVHIGLFCSTPGVAVARAVHRKQALKMLFTGDSISAQEAVAVGLINAVVPPEEVREAAEQLAGKIVRHSREVIGLGKEAFYKQLNKSRDEAYDYTECVMVDNLKHRHSQEGIESFFAKRKPSWK